MSRYHSARCATASNRYTRIRDSLTHLRQQLLERLYLAVPDSPRELRRFLLSVKRACFNGQPLERYRNAPQWPSLVELGEPLIKDILALESELEAVVERFEQEHHEVCLLQRNELFRQIATPSFRRGLALASPVMSRNASAGGDADHGHGDQRQKRLDNTLVRYVSRVALKLSPFSTFTRVALGAIEADVPSGIQLIGEDRWTERSLLRVKRYLLDQYTAALMQYEPFRRGLVPTMNNSLVKLTEARWRFVRPAWWAPDPESGALRYQPAVLASVRAEGGLVPWLIGELDDGRKTYGRVCEELRAGGGAVADVADLDQLIAIGFVQLLTPWSIDDAWVERSMLEHLKSLPRATGLDRVVDRLRELVRLEESYASTDSPERSLETIAGLIDELWARLKELAGIDSDQPLDHPSNHEYYEDVFLDGDDCGGDPVPVVRVSRASAQACLRSVDPVLRLSTLFRRDDDFLHTLAAHAATRWPGRETFGLIELFHAVQPIWQEYTEFCLASTQTSAGWRTTFNPLGLTALRELEKLRDDVWTAVPACIDEYDDHLDVSIEGLERLLARVPPTYRPKAGACVFAQPADPEGTSWVVNKIREGTGRFASRFTPVMGAATQREYLEALAAAGDRSRADGAGELIDVVCIHGDTVNVHAPHTHRVLTMPGEVVDLPRSRQLSLNDVHIRVDADTRVPKIYDDAGQHVIPAHLGGAHASYLPPLVRFICVFGPSELNPIFPPAPSLQAVGLMPRKRMVIGNVILRRRAWSLPVTKLRDLIAGLSEAHTFLVINHWRAKAGVPEQAFVIENLGGGSGNEIYRKPQYIDFGSPIFLRVFTSILQGAANDQLVIEEIMPTTQMMLSHADGPRWAVELLLDSIMLMR